MKSNAYYLKVIFILLVFHLSATTMLSAGGKAASGEKLSIPFRISSTGLLIVTMTYDGKPMQMIMDTGSGMNVISNESAKKLKLNMSSSSDRAAGIGTRSQRMSKVSPVDVVMNKKTLRLNNIVSMDLSDINDADGHRGVDGMLGSPFFREYDAQIDFATNKLIISIKKK